MIYIVIIIFIFTFYQFLISLINFIIPQKIPQSRIDLLINHKISILIPARNEESNIKNLLDDLKEIKNLDIEIFVLDDCSTDNTSEIVLNCIKSDNRIKLLRNEDKELPIGWLGKNYACYLLSKHANGDYFLFLDADVRINENVIYNSIQFLKNEKLGLLTIFPKQEMVSVGEKIVVPIMNYVLVSLLPLILVRKSKNPSLSAANGQFMLFDKSVYLEYQPHKKFSNSVVEDIKIARFLKSKGIRVACMLGDDRIKCRMYNDFNSAFSGFSKNILHFFGNSFLLSLTFWIVNFLGFLFVFLYLKDFSFVYLIVILFTIFLTSIVSEQSFVYNVLTFIPRQVIFLFLILNALLIRFTKRYKWKGRNVY